MDLESQMTIETMESLSVLNRRNESFAAYDAVVAPKTKKLSPGMAVEMGYVKAKGTSSYKNTSDMKNAAGEDIKDILAELSHRDEIIAAIHKHVYKKVREENAFLYKGNLTAALHAREDEIDQVHYKVRRNPKGNWAYMRSGKEQLYGNYFG